MIYVDKAAGSKDLMDVPCIAEQGCMTVLDSGDVYFIGEGPHGAVDIGIEVKSVADLIASQRSGRLTTQLERMQDRYGAGQMYLYWYGHVRANAAGGLEYSTNPIMPTRQAKFDGPGGHHLVKYSYLKHLLFCIEQAGFIVWHGNTIQDVAAQVRWLYDTWQRPWTDHRYLRTIDTSQTINCTAVYSADRAENERMKRLVGSVSFWPGVGLVRAEALAKAFSSARELYNVDRADIEAIPGFGKGLAKRICEWLDKRRPGECLKNTCTP